jgi:hypothetical protein
MRIKALVEFEPHMTSLATKLTQRKLALRLDELISSATITKAVSTTSATATASPGKITSSSSGIISRGLR